MTQAIERHVIITLAFLNFCSGGLRLCLSKCALNCVNQDAFMRCSAFPVPCTGAWERSSGASSTLGVAVASAATDSTEAVVCTAASLGSSSGFWIRSASPPDRDPRFRSASPSADRSASARPSVRQSRARRRTHRCPAPAAGRWPRDAAMSSPARSRSRGAEGDHRDRSARRCATASAAPPTMKRERGDACENPQPPGRF